MSIRNNVTRLLDSRKIDYTAFEISAEKHGAIETARLLGISPEIVYKTIVVKRKKGKPILAILSAVSEVDLKKVAKVFEEKKIFLTTQDEAEKLTKLQAGGISPLALINKGFDMVLDESARDYGQIHISGGQRGLNIRLGVDDLCRLTRARVAKIAKVG
ncbi:MAG: hypothetical protein DRI32_04885 [Chloroflexi bacterium]|nr:MAG: hypothetical protein DRI32_04885 [Chloroflexota bacterium]